MGDVMLRRDLLGRGLSEADLGRAVRSRELRRLRPGAFLATDDRRWADAEALHAALVEATTAHLAPGAVVSGISAAVLHGLPVWGTSLRTVDVTRDGRSGGRGGRRLRVHVAPLPAEDVVEVDGRATTSVARTLVDLARTTPFETAVTAVDASLHEERITVHALAVAVRAADGRHGVAGARAVLGFADGQAESPGESRSRVRMARLGVESPVLQRALDDVDGEYVGRVDFWWPHTGVIGEFDGLEKYGRSLRPGERLGDAVVREKQREDALRALPGVRTVVRWTWADLEDFAAVAARLPRAGDPPSAR